MLARQEAKTIGQQVQGFAMLLGVVDQFAKHRRTLSIKRIKSIQWVCSSRPALAYLLEKKKKDND